MSVRLWFTLFLCGASLAALIAPHPWTVRTGLVIFFAILAGLAFGRLLFRVSNQRRTATGAERSPQSLSAQDLPDEAEAVDASALLKATMKNMREGMLVVDEAMRVVASNRTAREIFSRVEGALEGKRLSDLTRNPAIHTAFSEAFERNSRADAKVEMQAADRRTFDLRVVPLHLSGDISTRGAVGVFFDITRLERLERVRQEFLSNVSHELRTPLTAIMAFVETLEDGAINDAENSQRFLTVIRRNAERMHNLIDDILELSDIEAGTHKVTPAPVRLSELVEDVKTALASRARTRGVTLRNEVASDVTVFADARRLEQMLTNLIDNAIKFNREQGTVTISHERSSSSSDGPNARDRISVADAGDGIPAEHVPRIFERFYRVDRARSRNMGGTGLGLAIVKHLALAHGGEVSVRSTPGQGSTFRIELPSLPDEQREEAAEEQAASIAATNP
ncbi:MAG TPA: ATP-binding protein [Pyrinomonadaceae bacterium]|jgi:two-component system phosphate regulon sensor histidine kinase PhoR